MEEKHLDIIIKKNSGEATEAELKELQEWIAKNTDNENEARKTDVLLGKIDSAFETYEPDTAGAWNKLKHSIETKPEKQKVVSFSARWILKVAAAVTLLGGLSFLFLNEIRENFFSSEVTEMVTADNVSHFYLPDSTLVKLNKNSRLTFYKKNNRSERKVTLSGEAFFQVKRDTLKTFIVSAEKAEVRVLGTSFNVRAYAGEEITVVDVSEGIVEVSLADDQNNKKSVLLTENQKLVYNKHSGFYEKGMSRQEHSNGLHRRF
jgi:transmembrane sensor